MGDLRRIGRLELPDDPAFTRTSWKWERAGWLLLAGFLVAGLLGLLGPGLLFSATTAGGAEDPLRVEYERFGHFESDDELTILLKPRPREGAVSFWFEDDYLDRVEVRDVHPTPAEVRLADGRKVYSFPVVPGATRVQVRFDINYRKVGKLSGHLGTSAGQPVEIRQFIYP
jgi:hypothetical protein